MNTWTQDIAEMHAKFGFNETVREFTPEKLKTLLEFRFKFLAEELLEGIANLGELEDGGLQDLAYVGQGAGEYNPEEIVDSLIDLIVVAIGTLDLFEVDQQKAWDAVHLANMAKERGIKPGRPNPLGLPDLLKPEGWTAPSHEGNHGLLTKING